MVRQDGATLALLLFFLFASEKVIESVESSKKANTEHRRGIAHADWLLQSLLTHTRGVQSNTAFIPHSVPTTRRFLHVTTLSCLFLDNNVDAVAVYDDNLTEGFFHARVACWHHMTLAKQTREVA